MGDGSFGVQNKVTRGQFAVMISRILGKQTEFKENFEDVSEDKYYYNDIGILKELGFIQGLSDTEFAPENNITRQDIAVILCRAAEFKGMTLSGTPKDFKDGGLISDYAKDAVDKVSSVGAAGGDENGNFNPQAFATRAEAAKMIYSIVK